MSSGPLAESNPMDVASGPHRLMARSWRLLGCGAFAASFMATEAWGQADETKSPPMRMPRTVEHRAVHSPRATAESEAGLQLLNAELVELEDPSALREGAALLSVGDMPRAEVLLRSARWVASERRQATELLWQISDARGVIHVDEERVASLGRVLGRGFARYEGQSVVLLSDASATVATARLGTLERTRAEFIKWARRAGLHPAPEVSKHVCVLFAKREAYIAFAAAEDGLDGRVLGGHYSAGHERMAMFVGEADGLGGQNAASTASHEASHMVAFRTGVQTRRRTQPFWLSEGLASAFEPIGQTIGTPDRVRPGLREAYLAVGEHERISIRALVSRDAPAREEMERLSTLYVTSEALVRYLSRHRREAFAAYIEAAATSKPGRRSPAELIGEFEAAFGDPDRVEREMRLRPW